MTTEDVRIEVLRALRDKLIEDLPRRCGDGGDSYLSGVEVALRHATDEINQRVALCIATPLPDLRAERDAERAEKRDLALDLGKFHLEFGKFEKAIADREAAATKAAELERMLGVLRTDLEMTNASLAAAKVKLAGLPSAADAASSLDRLRERVQAAKANDSANERWSAFHAFSCVVNWIDEERARATAEKGSSS